MSLEKNLENTQKEENVVLGIKDVLTKIVKLQVDNADLLVNLLQKDLEKGCVWKKHGKHGKRKFCCKTKRVCYGKKCKIVSRKCKHVGKIIKIFKKIMCYSIIWK